MPTAAPSDQDLLQLTYRQARALGLCREDAEDCAQEFVLRLTGNASAHRDSSAWINRCIHNFACNYLRGIIRRRATEQRAVECARAHGTRSALAPAVQPGPKTLVMQRDFCSQIRSLLAQFTTDQQELFIRYHLHHQDLAQLAARRGRSLHAVQQSLHNIHRRLARMLTERGWSDGDVRQLFVTKPAPPVRQSSACGR